jgi:hypothetical protein
MSWRSNFYAVAISAGLISVSFAAALSSSEATNTVAKANVKATVTTKADKTQEVRPRSVAKVAPKNTLTNTQNNAVRVAMRYLRISGFSRQGLIDQLSSDYGDGFSIADATIAVDSLQVDWKANAIRTASRYLELSGFSRTGLIGQLSSSSGSQFSLEEATLAVDSLDIDWNANATKTAKRYLELSGFSCRGLIQQLSSSSGNGYTIDQATFGAQQAGAC